MDVEALLAPLTPDQRAAVTSTAAPLVIVAPAGSGKTRVLTHRIAHRIATGTAHPLHCLAVTFTRAAAAELRQRLHELGVRDRVPAATIHAAALAQLRLFWLHEGRQPLTVLDRPTRVVRRVLSPDLAQLAPAVAAEISWATARLLDPGTYAAAALGQGRPTPLAPAQIADIWAAYQAELHRRGLISLDQLPVRCAEALHADTGFAAAQRWRFRHLFVDEAQDLTPAQWRLVHAWRGEGTDLCLVGDPCQAVYGWAGAEADALEQPHQVLPQATVVALRHNHRSRPEIVAAAARALPDPHEVTSTRPPGEAPRSIGAEHEEAEARAVAEAVGEALRHGEQPQHLAVLARSHARLDLVATELEARSIPVVRARRTAWERDPAVGAALDDLAEAPAGLDLLGAVRRLRADAADAGLPGAGEVVELVQEYLALEPSGDLPGFLSWLRTSEATARGTGVTLATFHAAKGREWRSVWVTGLESVSDHPEERRLLHVGLTRATDQLTISWVGAEAPPLARAVAGEPVVEEPRDWRTELAAVRARIREQMSAAAQG